ncbi:GLPGLI family protein, partial [Neptunitalea chrysea]|uniref:GLPGLI family protein n=1 Tax=Neptunitalea chrysea TaxID=1647581 RepID=UPI002492F02B
HVKNLSLDGGIDSKMPYISANGLGVQYRNLTTKEKYYQQKYGAYYLVKQQVIDNAWVITKETKKLQGYTCYKAIFYRETLRGKQKVTAWFTPQLSVPFGPSGFDGLPGLILQVQYGQHILTATKITFSKKVLEVPVPKGQLVENDIEMSKILSQDTGFDLTAHLKKLKEQSKEKKDKK